MLFAVLHPTLGAWAQDASSGSAGFTISSVDGNVVVKRANGAAEQVRPGMTLAPGDQLSSLGQSQATINLSSPSGTGATGSTGSGASLIVFSNTTIGVRGTTAQPSGGAGAGGFYVADLAKGVVLANTPSSANSTIQITHEHAGVLAQLNQGGMAMALDEGLGSMAVACDGRASQVFFPYADMRVPCEDNVVRTLSNTGGVDDQRADNTGPVNVALAAASAQQVQGTGNQGQNIVAPSAPGGSKDKDKDKENDSSKSNGAPASGPPSSSCTVPGASEAHAPGTSTFTVTQTPQSGGNFLYRLTVIISGGTPGKALEAFIFFDSPLLWHQRVGSFTLDSLGNGTFTGTIVQPGPATDVAEIGARLDSVSLLVANASLRADMRARLATVPDGARALSRLSLDRGGPRDLAAVARMIAAAIALGDLMWGQVGDADELADAAYTLRNMSDGGLAKRLFETLADDPPLLKRDGGFVRAGCDARLDEFRALRDESRRWSSVARAARITLD